MPGAASADREDCACTAGATQPPPMPEPALAIPPVLDGGDSVSALLWQRPPGVATLLLSVLLLVLLLVAIFVAWRHRRLGRGPARDRLEFVPERSDPKAR